MKPQPGSTRQLSNGFKLFGELLPLHRRKKIFKVAQVLLCYFFIFAMVFKIGVVPADATYKRMSDLTTDSDPGAWSNHTFTLVPSDDIPVSGQILFDFMLGAWLAFPVAPNYTDVDFSVDGLEWPVASSPGSGASSSVGVSIPTGADTEVLITLNNTDSIRASSTIVVKVGTNATYEYTGDRQFRNFAPEGDWYVDTYIYDPSTTTPLDYMRNWVNFIDPVVLSITEVTNEPETEEEPPPTNVGPGSYSQPPGPTIYPTGVIVSGKSFPASRVRILRDGTLIDTVNANNNGDFTYQTTNLSSGITTLTFISNDVYELTSNPLALTFFIESGKTTNVTGALVPPSIDLDTDSSPLKIFGQTVPNARVLVNFTNDGGTTVNTVSSSAEGLWEYLIDANTLPEGESVGVKAQFRLVEADGDVLLSTFSQTLSFKSEGGEIIVDTDPCARSDLNRDGRVNLTDFSILLFNWGTADPVADINLDGSVNLTDFSIMLFCWTG